jgi:hypothetical protein
MIVLMSFNTVINTINTSALQQVINPLNAVINTSTTHEHINTIINTSHINSSRHEHSNSSAHQHTNTMSSNTVINPITNTSGINT